MRRPYFHQTPLPTTKPRIIRNGISTEWKSWTPSIQLKSRVPCHTSLPGSPK